MTKILGTILAMLMALNGAVSQLPIEETEKVLVSVFCGVVIAGLTYYLRDNATTD